MLASFDALFPHDDWVEFDTCALLNGVTPVRARLLYEQAAPWAVTLVLYCGSTGEREWLFGRDLLAEGLLRDTGEGDVLVRPDGDSVWVTLYGSTTSAALEFSRAAVEKALEATENLVPPGTESLFFDWDREWDRLTGEAA